MIIAVALLALLAKNGTKKIPREPSTNPEKPKSAGWIGYLALALIIAIWTVYGALFLLAVVWIMRQNPKRDSSHPVSDTEKNTAKRLYTWLFLSPLFTVPIFIISAISISSGSSVNQRVLTALIPLIFHIPLLLGFTSKSIFVVRHTQQSILLMAIRAGMASFSMSMGTSYPSEAILLFIFGNGALWLFSSIWGWDQIGRGECWLMKHKGESPVITTGAIEDLTPQVHIERSREFIGKYKAEEAKNHALSAFRRGDREVKQQAVQILTNLHEVEKF